MVFVDDGSRDRTLAIAVELARRDPRVRVVKFRRNYGQTAAMAAGIEHARGEIIVTMDGDLQNDPADIPRCSRRSTQATTSWSAGATTARTSWSRARFPRESPTG